jgi:palmitoyl-protein thioesterase
VAQRCPDPPMKNYISIGGQHQGVYGIPGCDEKDMSTFCSITNKIISFGVSFNFIRTRIVQGAYWHDPLNEQYHRDNNAFLGDINQETQFKKHYRDNFLKLKSVVLVKFTKDDMVIPIESQWFGFFKPNTTDKIYKMEESPLYYDVILNSI